MKMDKIVEFAKNNWEGIGTLAMFAVAETLIVVSYRKYLKGML